MFLPVSSVCEIICAFVVPFSVAHGKIGPRSSRLWAPLLSICSIAKSASPLISTSAREVAHLNRIWTIGQQKKETPAAYDRSHQWSCARCVLATGIDHHGQIGALFPDGDDRPSDLAFQLSSLHKLILNLDPSLAVFSFLDVYLVQGKVAPTNLLGGSWIVGGVQIQQSSASGKPGGLGIIKRTDG